MALARVQYESDGSTTVYSIPFPYINRDDIKVSIDGTETNDFVFLDGSTINLDAAPSQGLIVDVIRETERNDLLVEFNDGSTLLETDLTLAAQQSFFIAQEAFDQADATLTVANDGTYSASTRRISLLGYPLNFEDAANKQYVDNIFAQGEDAYEQATIADNAATTAAGARDAAQLAEATTGAYKNSASQSAGAANTSETNAASSATAAQLAEATTLNYRNTTEEYKNLASQSAGAANTSETNAASSATAAQLAEDDVATNATAAQLAETNAQSHRAAAQNSETAAAGSANNANNSETAASNSEAKAAQWADWGEDRTVEPGKYSAKHHSIKASDSATSASNDANAASSSANAASISEDNASSSELAASTSEANASDAETDAVTAKDASIQAKNDAQALYGDLAAVDAAKTNAVQAASTATSAADVAQESARLAAAFYPSVTLALQETVSGQYFQIAENGYVQLYLNDAGAAKPLLKMASQESLDALNARPDPLLTSLLF